MQIDLIHNVNCEQVPSSECYLGTGNKTNSLVEKSKFENNVIMSAATWE